MSQRHILVTGGTGFIGRPLCMALLKRGDRVTVLSRQPADVVRRRCGAVNVIHQLEQLREPVDGVINLAGEPIADRPWTSARRKKLEESRIALTRALVNHLRQQRPLPAVLVSGSAVGYYGDQGDAVVNETTPPRDEYTHQLCAAWEAEAHRAAAAGIRVCVARTGLVIGTGGGFLSRLLLPFRLGLGGRLGAGTQFMPWIHVEDEVRALLWMLDTPAANGPYNVTAPTPVPNARFTTVLAEALNRPAFLPVPAFALSLLGEMSRLLLTGQDARPARLLEAGFEFHYRDLPDAIDAVLRR